MRAVLVAVDRYLQATFCYIRAQAGHLPEWHRVFAWSNLSKFARTLQKGQLIVLEGTLRYREYEEDVHGLTVRHRIAEIHASSMKRLSKVEAPEDPSDGADDE
jgi:single-strand DNA-binding protein